MIAVGLTLALGSAVAPGRAPVPPLGRAWAPGLSRRVVGVGESDGVGLAREAAWIRRSAAAATDRGGEGSGPGRRWVSCERVNQSVSLSVRRSVSRARYSSASPCAEALHFFRSRGLDRTRRRASDGGKGSVSTTLPYEPDASSPPLHPSSTWASASAADSQPDHDPGVPRTPSLPSAHPRPHQFPAPPLATLSPPHS